MSKRSSLRLAMAAMLAALLAVPDLAAAIETTRPALPPEPVKPAPTAQSPAPAAVQKPLTANKAVKKKRKVVRKKPVAPDIKTPAEEPKKTGSDFLNGYRLGHDLVYRQNDYVAGIAAMRTLHQDDHPDVANIIGFASRKLGRYDDAAFWYDRALAADPNHTRTRQYYGLWHLEQGNRLKAEDHLERIRLVCGAECEDFLSLKRAIERGAAGY